MNFEPTSYSARTLALAWRAVFQAAPTAEDDDERQGAIAIEQHQDGLLLTGINRAFMLWTFVASNIEDEPSKLTPDDLIDAAPIDTFMVQDKSGLPKALVKWIIATTKDGSDRDYFERVELEVGSIEADDRPTLDPALDRTGLTITYGDERIAVPMLELPPVSWRAVWAKHTATAKKRRAFTSTGFDLGQLRRLAGVHVDEADEVAFTVLDATGAMRIHIDGRPAVHGLIMPTSGRNADETPAAA
jgi:hypothetical protein